MCMIVPFRVVMHNSSCMHSIKHTVATEAYTFCKQPQPYEYVLCPGSIVLARYPDPLQNYGLRCPASLTFVDCSSFINCAPISKHDKYR